MFGKSSGSHLHVGATTLIAKTTEVVGDVHFSGNLEVEGVIKGSIIADDGSNAAVRILQHGKVIGDIRAPSIIINGEVQGEVFSTKHVELAAKANIQGNVHYHSLEVVKGAQVNGNMVHQGGSGSVGAAPEPAPIAEQASPRPVAKPVSVEKKSVEKQPVEQPPAEENQG